VAERETAKDMVVRYSPGAERLTVGADKGFDTADFVADMRDFNVTPHVALNTTNRLSAIDHRTTRHCGYEISQQKRKRVEEPFGWGKTIGGLARPMARIALHARSLEALHANEGPLANTGGRPTRNATARPPSNIVFARKAPAHAVVLRAAGSTSRPKVSAAASTSTPTPASAAFIAPWFVGRKLPEAPSSCARRFTC